MKGLINLKNKDIECFKWSHARFLNPQNKNSDRINKQDKKIASTLDYRGINFPMKARDYAIIEERFEINVNVFGYVGKVLPLCVSKKFNEQVLNIFIKDFNRLIYSQVKAKNVHKKHFCMAWLQNFTTKEILNNHIERSLLINHTQAVKCETGIIKLKNYGKQIPIAFKIYADTECFLKRINIDEGKYTKLYQKHIPNSIGAKLVCIDDRFTLPSIIFKGKDCINKFITWVLDKQRWTKQITKQYFNKRLIMTNEDEEIYNNPHICWICKQELNMDKVRDHCHVTGKFRGAAHNKCNLKLRIPRKLPIIFHNLQGYDGHIIFKELNNFDVDISVIPKGIDKYMSIIVNRYITFIDSFQFYKGSLDSHVSNFEDSDFKYLLSEFPADKLEILKRKDRYRYEWVDSYEKFNYQQLPPKECFYSSLKDGKRDNGDGHISDEEYLHLKMYGKNLILILLKISIIII